MIELGRTGKDKITGFQGVVVGVATYLTGCNQVLLVPPLKKDGALEEACWFDEQRVQAVGRKRVKLENGDTPGCDKPAPKR